MDPTRYRKNSLKISKFLKSNKKMGPEMLTRIKNKHATPKAKPYPEGHF
jgi:hypothetical protein